jgi:hypothetical protein
LYVNYILIKMKKEGRGGKGREGEGRDGKGK